MPPDLSPQHLATLALVGRGYTSPQIAVALQVTEHSVDWSMRVLMARFGARSRVHLVAVAFKRGVLR
jgi:LuxR family transcriptional regulator, quorum-sensing system regulator SdiA